jgi:hypothetical protein
MAEEKKSFPMLPISHRWALRKKFKQSIPGVVTDSYLATVLEMGANSARANVLPFLKTLGIIDEQLLHVVIRFNVGGFFVQLRYSLLEKTPESRSEFCRGFGHCISPTAANPEHNMVAPGTYASKSVPV